MKRPLFAVLVCYTAGLLLAEFVYLPPAALLTTAFLLLALALLRAELRPHLLGLLLIMVGWTNNILHTAVIAPDDLRTLIGTNAALATVRGTLVETPKLKLVEHDGEITEHSVAQVRVSRLRQSEYWQPAFGELIVTTPGALSEDFFAGQPVEIPGVIARPPRPLAEGLFDYRKYLETRGIYFQLKTVSTNDWQLGEPAVTTLPLTDRFLNWSKRTLALGLPVEDESLRLLWAMTLGWRTAFTGDIGDPFLRAGTMHLFAIDGLRIALISGMLVALLRVLQISRAWCGLFAIPLIWFYTAATGWESSAVRASVMISIVLGGWALKRPGDLLNSLAAAGFIILLWDPRQLLEASFQLSFSVMLVIGLLLPRLNQFTDSLLRYDPLLPDALVPKWRRAFHSVARTLARYCSLSFAAWIGSIPLSAKYFHLFSPISTPANVIAVPLGTLALMANLGALICGTWFPLATALFNHSAWFFMSAMTAVSEWATKIPGAYFYVPEPSWFLILSYYLAVVVLLSGWLKTRPRKYVATAILLLIGAFHFWQWDCSRKETEITVLPLNGGHAVYVDAAGQNNDWLVNCGNTNAVQFTLKDFLRAHGANHVPRLVLTEGTVNSCGGARLLEELFDIGEIWTSRVNFRSSAYRNAVAEFEKPSGSHRFFDFGETHGGWQVLSPAATNAFPRADDNALVLLGTFPGVRILLLSDLGRLGQSALLDGTNNLRADIVVAGLPKEGEPLCDSLLAAIQPKAIVIADSEFPAQRRASRDLTERLGRTGIPIFYTRISGAVTILADKSDWKLRTMDEQEFEP